MDLVAVLGDLSVVGAFLFSALLVAILLFAVTRNPRTYDPDGNVVLGGLVCLIIVLGVIGVLLSPTF